MERFLPSSGASSAPGKKRCEDPTCTVPDSTDDEDRGGRPESCVTSSMTEAEVRGSLEKVRSYLYANGKDGEYRETQYLLSKVVHSFTHETQVKRRAKEGGELQATLRDMWRS
ncbi:unnamed protein product [Ectocarpus sp. CCAP 1310/34]|nr:unnamed protein product [Ectocarpus sp. CCAP 1310/34]